ncbi:2-dehydropantoate 2-reductase [Paenibacillus sp. F411]|uniref:2-dehydropantoate 2-reductase n=1 Tax=Paenibacillus algicola TaxID=2565926 RepID=A0A4P8XKS3_9BACL|nr:MULTISPECIES: 2-dehydropantoate 2-reductase [Paenibacillus]MBO2943223.1 2-dehydropantoate 2-reductase [Paenibacillus sp. F411]QCT02220.1 2-dehydropantoate 2-reductase [Paenibacillus algicola]
MLSIHIVGAGSLGLLFAGRLAYAGARVTLWCRTREQKEVIQHSGIVIRNLEGQVAIQAADQERLTVSSIDEYHGRGGPQDADFTLLTVKQGAVKETAEQLFVPYQGHRLVCLQNGTGHVQRLNKLLPAWQVYTAVTTEGASRAGLAEVVHAGSGETHLGLMKALHPQEPALQGAPGNHSGNGELELKNLMHQAGFKTFLSNSLDKFMYRKLLINAVINPLTALWRVTNGELLASDERIAFMRLLYEEGTAVYRACGISYDEDLWERILGVCRATSGNTSSMLRDVEEGKETEIAAINGSIVHLAEGCGVQAAAHRLIWRLIEGLHH